MKATPPPIADFESLIEPHLNGRKVVSYSSRYLTKPGENYGSIMLSITVNVKNANGEIEALPLVAKMPPVLSDFYWKLFEPERTCLTENAMYSTLVPEFQTLFENAGVPEEALNLFPKSYGSRVNLGVGSESVVDKNALLVLENLQTSGYRAGNRGKFFDFSHTKVILESLAKFHAYPVALRVLKPFVFKTKIMPFFQRFDMNDNMTPEFGESYMNKTLIDVQRATDNDEKVLNRFKELAQLSLAFNQNPEQCKDGLYSTIAHYDFWINNMMILYDENNQPSHVKIVDFQIAQYESLVHDLMFFFLSSVETDVLNEHYEEFLQHYYDTFVSSLKSLGAPVQNYSMESFHEEIKKIAPLQITHAIFMLKVIFMPSDSVPESFDEMDPEVFTTQESKFDEKYYQKIRDVIRFGQKWGFI